MRGRKAHSSLSSVGVPVGGEAVLLTVSGRKVVVVLPLESVARTPVVWEPLESAVKFGPFVQAAAPAAAAKRPPSTCTATAVTPLPAVVPCSVIWPEKLALSLGEVIVTPGPCGMLWPQKAFVQPGSKLQ